MKFLMVSGGEIVGVLVDLSMFDGVVKVVLMIVVCGDDFVYVLVYNSGVSWGVELESYDDKGFVKTY